MIRKLYQREIPDAPVLPDGLSAILDGYACAKNRVGCSFAGVYKYSKGENTLYLKTDRGEALHREYEVLRWLGGKLPVPEVKYWGKAAGVAFLLTREIVGHMACECPEDILVDPYENMVKLLAEGLRMLQSVEINGCPFNNTLDKKLAAALYNTENNLVDTDDFEDNNTFDTPMDLYRWLTANRPPEELCFTHGDYCLPNIFIDEKRVTGFIDLGDAGVADKWQDIALCVRSLRYNLRNTENKERYIDLFFEYLGIAPDLEKINYYILLDELF